MKFPNAFEGVKKIFLSEILTLIAGVLAVIGAIAALAGSAIAVGIADTADMSDEAVAQVAGGAVAAVGVGGVVALIGGIIMIVAFIIYLIGVNKAKKDNDNFAKAFMWVIISLIFSIIVGFFSATPTVGPILSACSSVVSCLATFYIVNGIADLADQLGNSAVAGTARTLIKVLFVVYALQVIASLIGGFASGLSLILSIVATILGVIANIVYLIILAQGKKVLEG